MPRCGSIQQASGLSGLKKKPSVCPCDLTGVSKAMDSTSKVIAFCLPVCGLRWVSLHPLSFPVRRNSTSMTCSMIGILPLFWFLFADVIGMSDELGFR